METGLDYAFLKYIGVTSENQIPVRRFFLPFFSGCERVVDLGCGGGDFVALLKEAGVEALGVDTDPLSCASMRERNLPVIEQDVITYLESIEASSLDGIYSAHLVEHLPYEAVLKLIRLAYRALRPGGRLVLVTPNPRSLFAHLELYHMHFGHEAFYHPKLLSFFLDYCGFERIEDGENPHSGSFLLGQEAFSPTMPHLRQGIIQYRRQFPPVSNPVRRLIRWGKTLLFRFVVQPFLDDIMGQANQILLNHHTTLQRIQALDRPFECYVIGHKPAQSENQQDSGR